MMKNTFYFTLKALFILKIFFFDFSTIWLYEFLIMQKMAWLER